MIMNLNSREEIYFMNNRNVELRDDEMENKSSDGYDSDDIFENSDDDFFDNDTSFEQHYVDRNFIFLEDDRLVSSLDQKLNFDKINFNSTFKSIDDEFQTFKSFFKFNDKIISSGNSSFKSWFIWYVLLRLVLIVVSVLFCSEFFLPHWKMSFVFLIFFIFKSIFSFDGQDY